MIAAPTELNIASEFSVFPGPRKRSEGEFSGEQFLEELLRPRFELVRAAGTSLHVNLDGAAGYPTSFLEEAFGGLARLFSSDDVRKFVEITCTDEPYLVEQIWKYVREARGTRK